MTKATDIRVIGAALYFLPVQTRLPLKFGAETLTFVDCARVCLTVRDRTGRIAEGWGETPLSVQWVWPSALSYEDRHRALKRFSEWLAEAWADYPAVGDPIELGHRFQEEVLDGLVAKFNRSQQGNTLEPLPRLAALVCCSAYDLAVHDAYGQIAQLPVYRTYHNGYLNRDLSAYLEAEEGSGVSFKGKYPADFLKPECPKELRAWHLVGGLDALDRAELSSPPPEDGHPSTLPEWIDRDGLKCLKVKLRGNDAVWDYDRLVRVGRIGRARKVDWLSADFNCTVTEPAYVNAALDRLRDKEPKTYGMILYVEQPFPYELETHRIDVHSVSARKPLFLDESAHDWRQVRVGRKLGWSGVALKTCKTQTGALLSACWARAHGMELMVQDLTNPMLAQIPHLQLAGYVGTIMGVETNAMQFYPDASIPEAQVHPGLYQRRKGQVNLSSIEGPGFGYRLAEIQRELPLPAVKLGGREVREARSNAAKTRSARER